MLLEVKDLNTYYGDSHALRDMSLAVEQGEIVALLGRNGMGKSTTLKTIMGLLKPRSGEVSFKEQNIAGMEPYKVAKTGIGYVPEERRIFSEFNGFGQFAHGHQTRQKRKTDRRQSLDDRAPVRTFSIHARAHPPEGVTFVRR